jgi:very-short-patch-repair endonuclease
MLKGTKRTVRRARSLRRKMTLPEVLLWKVLRTRPDGFKFRRQHPAGSYVLDFYCEQASLAIEVDGRAHESRFEADIERDRRLAGEGIRTLRLPADYVLDDPQLAVVAIVEACRARLLHHPPAAGGLPPLQGGSG